MQQLEENGEDSREVILQVLGDIEERLGEWNSGALKVYQ
jgi:hypothetical protein